MVRKSLMLMTLLAVASPITAQEEYVWSFERPDGVAPAGVVGARILGTGDIKVSYRFSQLASRGVWLGSDSVPLASTLEIYQSSPLTHSYQGHNVSVWYGVTDRLTVGADAQLWSGRLREQLTDSAVYFKTGSYGIGDVAVSGMYDIVDERQYKAHFEMGVLIPTGAESVFQSTPLGINQAQPYDMRRGAGTFALLPGLTGQTQNEFASVGAQLKGRIYIRDNSSYTRGQAFDGSVWAARRLNEYISISARVQWQHWAGIDGGDPNLVIGHDPGNNARFLGGERIDVPIGVNFYFPEGARFGGNRWSLETIFPISHEYQGHQLGLDWGVTITWRYVHSGGIGTLIPFMRSGRETTGAGDGRTPRN